MLDGRDLEPTSGLVEALREVKDPDELVAMREAAAVADRALAGGARAGHRGAHGAGGRVRPARAMLEEGAEAPSFDTIVAAGPRGARPHPVPSADPIPRAPSW